MSASLPLEAYALIGDCRGAALVSTRGGIDWLVTPHFDSGACFSALLGEEKDGAWRVGPVDQSARVSRGYRGDTLILETMFATAQGTARLTDAMLIAGERPRHIVRLLEGLDGELEFETRFLPRFDYGSSLPWLQEIDGAIIAIAGPDGLVLRTSIALERHERLYEARFHVRAGERIPFVLTWFPSHLAPPTAIDLDVELTKTQAWWAEWSSRCTYQGPYREAVMRSALTLKALSFEPTGAIVAAPTTSLPETLGGVRNWDYRYCWLRDATFTMAALLNAGFRDEAEAFTAWLTRAIAGDPAELQVLYGLSGERRLPEHELDWLAGYEQSRPVRVGNAAYAQFQLDVYGEVVSALALAVHMGMQTHEAFWEMLLGIVDFVAAHWDNIPDKGMWEMRGAPRHFVYSKVMSWVAIDSAIKLVEAGVFSGPVDQWHLLRDRMSAQILERGFDAAQGAFVQSYGATHLDASLLRIVQTGFLPPSDPRISGTVTAIERELVRYPFVKRYDEEALPAVDKLPSGDGAFLACSFWLCDAYVLMGEREKGHALFKHLLSLRNDVGLLSEEYDLERGRLVGNFPQAFSHLALINSAYLLAHADGEAQPVRGYAPQESTDATG